MTDRLFEGDCCALCGGTWEVNDLIRNTGPHRGTKYCRKCNGQPEASAESKANIDAEITKRRSLQPSPAPGERFKAGDRVRVSANPEITGTVSARTAQLQGDVWVIWDERPATVYGTERLELIRRAHAAAELETYYSERPDPLPLTLPAGTKWKNKDYSGEFTYRVAMRYTETKTGIVQTGSSTATARADWIDWKTTVKRPPVGDSQAPIRCVRCTVEDHRENRVDPATSQCAHCQADLMNEAKYGKACAHPRRFRSGVCVSCGHVGPGENDAGYGIPCPRPAKVSIANMRPMLKCNEPGCNCAYCRHRPWSKKIGAADHAALELGRNDLDASIAAARSEIDAARGEERRAPWDWPGVDEFEVVPRVLKIGDK